MISIDDTAVHCVRPSKLDDCRVMIVSGDPRTRERLFQLVLLNAFEPRLSESGAEALAWLELEHCPVVLVDSRLPDLPAEQVCTALRSGTDGRYRYTVVICDPADPRAVVNGLRAGADDCVSRAAQDAELVARLEVARRVATLEHSLRAACDANERLAIVDPLTGVYNRRHLDRQLPRELERSRRYVRPLSLVAFDLDHFKAINDHYGHDAGDRVLRTVARAVRRRLRRGVDWLARSGGEEFVVVLPETGLQGARVVAERLRAAIAAERVVVETTAGEPRELTVTASFGVAAVEELTDVALEGCERLLARADASLYRSKRLGRNCVTAYAAPAA